MAITPDQMSEMLTVRRIAQLLTCHKDPNCSDPAMVHSGEWMEAIAEAIEAGELQPVDGDGKREKLKGLWTDSRRLHRHDVCRWLNLNSAVDGDIPPGLRPANKGGDDLHPKREATYQRIIATLLALEYGREEVTTPYKLADEILADCQKHDIEAPAGRTTLGDLLKGIPSVRRANPD